MIGAILVSALAAVASSLFATLSNFVIARKDPELSSKAGSELPEAVFMHMTWYRLVARLFYLQALFFWALFAILLLVEFLIAR